MDKAKRVRRFVSRNIITIVTVPSIIAVHIGWSAIQKNRTLVKEHEEIDLPVITFYKYCLRRLGAGKTPTEVAAVKIENP